MHVNADVAEAMRRYIEATGDLEFERDHALGVLVETARLWAGIGSFDRNGAFRIAGVTGPDEYSALVDDNVFTNLMAQANLEAAAAAAERHVDVAGDLDVTKDEIDSWRRAALVMYVPYDEDLEIHPQDENFLSHGEWDWDSTEPEDYPLLLHHPYFELYRRRVVKQADLVLALWRRGGSLTPEVKRRDFEFYEPITVRDSSLSACAQAVVANEVGHTELAWDYLREAALTDLADLHRNAHDGLHMASLAGAVLAAIAGLGGLRDEADGYHFHPRLPKAVDRLCFRLTIHGSRLRVTIQGDEVEYLVECGDEVAIFHWGDEHTATEDGLSLSVPERPDLEPPKQPPGREPGAPLPEPARASRTGPAGSTEGEDQGRE
jgi:alpha,alpha-trehalose phosphorylase